MEGEQKQFLMHSLIGHRHDHDYDDHDYDDHDDHDEKFLTRLVNSLASAAKIEILLLLLELI